MYIVLASHHPRSSSNTPMFNFASNKFYAFWFVNPEHVNSQQDSIRVPANVIITTAHVNFSKKLFNAKLESIVIYCRSLSELEDKVDKTSCNMSKGKIG